MKCKPILCFLLSLLLLFSLCGCGTPAAKEAEITLIDDRVRNWYEVFVYSFADSDGDGIGDLKGLTGKLDYLSDLGINGLWLMPVMPSPSYHKYDVTDYRDIDPQYGTLDDFRTLLSEAHERGIRVIIDLPINHSSDLHPWFISAAADVGSPYRAYYLWSDTPQTGYSERNGNYYESRFVSSMPDLNLDNEQVRAEIEEILRFWLVDVGVDGFRLDAVTSYYTGQLEQNLAFLNWLGDTAHTISPDCFLVGEAWDNLSVIARYAGTSIDSYFTFPVSQAEGYLAKTLSPANRRPGQSYAEYTLQLERELPASTIPAPFTENHDTGRTVGFTGRDNPTRTKMAGGLLCMMRGGVFLYYGQEIGMVGSGEDPNKRIGMLWTSPEETTAPPPGVTRVEYAYPSVAEQEADSGSILNYYRDALTLRNRFPAIARGNSEILPCESDQACLILRTWEDQRLLLAINPSGKALDLSLSGEALDYPVLSGSLLTGSEPVSLSSGKLTLPACSIAVLSRGER